MQDINDVESFNLQIELMVDTLKLQNKAILKSVEELLAALIGFEYTSDILMAAVLQLSETDADACRWTLRNLHDIQHLDVIEELTKFAVKKLISRGFIFGQDFSMTPNSRIILNRNAMDVLIAGTSIADSLLLEEISQVVEYCFS
ncbi:MAG: hypothetical protein KME32_26075 [Mojavia pulchra JT2-VF2]|uniref:Uncharacterized protein n=1 Tax=Mojavia pulchra JT2-VF2 TaxID=287848 RepID=A0A951Q4D4_9NOST|nr:hypothetical protein [Mojavia pulchra JT2-VF2]